MERKTLQDKVLAWKTIKESFILESKRIASVFITLLKLDVYKDFSEYWKHPYLYIKKYWLYLNFS